MQWGFLAAWLCALSVAGAQEAGLSPEVAELARIKAAVSQTLSRQPDYTCIQQIERSHRRLPKRKFELQDLLRIEVALVDGKEMFAWPGASTFEQTDLTEMVSGGAIGTGDFALHARAVFQTSAPRFSYAGLSDFRARKAAQYDFVVSLLGSGYRIKSGGREAIVGFHGTFWADAATGDLLRLEIDADDIPPELGVASVRDVMDYGRVKIGDSEFLLPIGSDLAMTDLHGNQNRNRTQFKSCRQYSGESVLTFAGPAESEIETVPAARTKQPVEIPAGLSLDIRLTTAIDSDESAVGDAVTAVLDQSVKVKGRRLFEKGAALTGRVLRLERHGNFAIIDLRFSTVESGDSRAELRAKLEEIVAPVVSGPMRSTFNAGVSLASIGNGVPVQGNHIHLRPGSRLRLSTF